MKKDMLRTVVVIGVAMAGVLPNSAMPTAKEIEKIRPMVEELMKADVAKMRRGQMKPAEMAEAAVKLSKDADTQAAKYYLLTSALPHFAKDGKYDRVLATIDDIKAAVPDVPTKELVRMVEPLVARAPKTDEGANRLREMVNEYRTMEKSEAQAEKMRQAIARNPSDRSLHTKLAEYMAVIGNWDVALTEFAQGDNREAARIAKAESAVGGIAKVAEVADFWWDYADGRSKSVGAALRQHAANLYRQGIDEGKITGLTKVQAERRIAEFLASGAKLEGQSAKVAAAPSGKTKVVAPAGAKEMTLGANVKLSFATCAAGKFTMGWPEAELKKVGCENIMGACEVTITKPFWMAETLVSESTWAAVMGGAADSANPKSVNQVELKQFLEKCNKNAAGEIPAGYELRLPTYAEYEYALKAGGAEKGTPFAKLELTDDAVESVGQDPYADVTKPKPNKWNLRGLRMKGGFVWLADKLSFDKSEMSTTGFKWDAVGMRVNRINWPKTATDPLVPNKGGPAEALMFLRDKSYLHPYGAYDKTQAFIRLVLAPKR